MINFSHISCSPDGKNGKKIARRMIRKSKKTTNKLDFLIGKHLETKLITPIKISSIVDFPILRPKQMMKKIFFGSYQLKQARAYADDLLSNKKAYIVNSRLIKNMSDKSLTNEDTNSKILAFEIISRHRRSKKNFKEIGQTSYVKQFKNIYKVFIEYIPELNNTKSIQGKIKILIYN